MCISLRTQRVRGACWKMVGDRGGHISLINLLYWILSEKIFHEREGSCKARRVPLNSTSRSLLEEAWTVTHDARPTTHDPLPTQPRQLVNLVIAGRIFLVFVNENCCLCIYFTELYFFYWLLVVSLVILIAVPFVFSRSGNIACRSTQNATRIKRFGRSHIDKSVI